MSVDHHLEQIALLMFVSLAEGVLRAEQKRSRRANFLRYQSLLHRNRVQNPNDWTWTSKARIEWKLMKVEVEVDVKRTVGGVVGEQEHLNCEMLDSMEVKELSGSVQDR